MERDVKRNKIEKRREEKRRESSKEKRERRCPRVCEGERCGMSVPLLWVRLVIYTPIDRSDTLYVMSYRAKQGCRFAGMSGCLLIMGG